MQVIPPKRMTVSLVFLSSCIALLMTGFGVVVPVFPQRLEALGLGAGTLALMEGAFGLGMFLFSTPIGMLGDHIGRKPIILISLSGFIMTNVVLATVNIPLVFIFIRFVEGVIISGLMPASMAMIGDSIPKEQQSHWIGFITAAQATGFALGPSIGGFLYQAWGFSYPFLISAAIAGIASLLALILLPETLSKHIHDQVLLHRRKEQSSKIRATTHLSYISANFRTFIPLLIIDCSITFVYPFVLPQYPFFIVRILGYSTAQFGIIVSAYALSLAAFPMLLGRLNKLFPKKLFLILGSLLYLSLNAGLLFSRQYAVFIAAAVLTGMGNALLLPVLGSIYLGTTTKQDRSQVMGLRGTATSLGILLGPLVQALVSPWITPQMTFAIGIILSLMITLFIFVSLKC